MSLLSRLYLTRGASITPKLVYIRDIAIRKLSGTTPAIPEPPTHCCMQGCDNCVWVSYAEQLTDLFKDKGETAFRALKAIPDPSLRSFVELELKLKLGTKN